MKIRKIAFIVSCLALCACGTQKNKAMEETEVLIETSMGDIRVKLYNDTPKHRDNFIKLAKAGVYDNILFHRVVRGFMVQTGDPRLKAAGAPLTVDTAAYNYTLPAEIRYPAHFHKQGALAAARMGDDVNPDKESSGTQFYIVTGKTYTAGALMELYSAIYQSRVDAVGEKLARKHMKEMYMMRRNGVAGAERLLAARGRKRGGGPSANALQRDAEAGVCHPGRRAALGRGVHRLRRGGERHSRGRGHCQRAHVEGAPPAGSGRAQGDGLGMTVHAYFT